MAFDALLTFVYKEIPTAAKMRQLVENIVTHDHRADGSQGAPLEITDPPFESIAATVGAATNYAISGTPRARLVAGGSLIALDLVLSRTGDSFTFQGVEAANPGNTANNLLASGIPEKYRVATSQFLVADVGTVGQITAQVSPDGTVSIVHGYPNGNLDPGDLITIRGVLWRG